MTAQTRRSAIGEVSADQVKAYDFRAAAALDTARLSTISAANEVFARNLSETFTRRFDAPCQIAVGTVDLAACDAFVDTANEQPPYLHSLLLGPHGEIGVLQMEKGLLLVLLDCLLGGAGQPINAVREMTDIETQMAQELVKIIASELEGAWKNFKIGVKVGERQTSDDLAQALSGSAVALVPTLKVKVSETEGKFQLMLPIPVIAPSLRAPVAAKPVSASSSRPGMSPKLAAALLESSFNIDLVLARGKVHANELLNLAAGEVLDLHVTAGSPAVASIGGKAAFSALPVRAGNHRAAQLVDRLSEKPAATK